MIAGGGGARELRRRDRRGRTGEGERHDCAQARSLIKAMGLAKTERLRTLALNNEENAATQGVPHRPALYQVR